MVNKFATSRIKTSYTIINCLTMAGKDIIIIEDSAIGVKAGFEAGVKVLGLTAGKHWYINRDKNELYKNGASNVFDSYENLSKVIEEL